MFYTASHYPMHTTKTTPGHVSIKENYPMFNQKKKIEEPHCTRKARVMMLASNI